VQRYRVAQAGAERRVITEEVRVFFLQQRNPQCLRRGNADTLAARIAVSSESGSCSVPIFRLSDST
jgi:hypothetical protein